MGENAFPSELSRRFAFAGMRAKTVLLCSLVSGGKFLQKTEENQLVQSNEQPEARRKKIEKNLVANLSAVREREKRRRIKIN